MNESKGALTEAVYYILISLYTPLHGYGVIQNVEARGRSTAPSTRCVPAAGLPNTAHRANAARRNISLPTAGGRRWKGKFSVCASCFKTESRSPKHKKGVRNHE